MVTVTRLELETATDGDGEHDGNNDTMMDLTISVYFMNALQSNVHVLKDGFGLKIV